jgi:hypothetical protein
MRIISLFFLLLIFFSSSYSINCFAADKIICFYNPEIKINDFVTLKNSLDHYLARKGNYQFQPFDNHENFKKSLQIKGSIFLLPGWSLGVLQKQNFPLKIALIGTVENTTEQQKFLSARKEFVDFASLKNATIAATGDEAAVRKMLQEMNPQYKEIAETLKIRIVPKEIDALLAINNGVADAAIASQNNLKTLAAANAKQYQQLHTLASSKKDYFLVVATLGAQGKEEVKAIDVLYNMTKEDAGQETLQLLGVDGWVRK